LLFLFLEIFVYVTDSGSNCSLHSAALNGRACERAENRVSGSGLVSGRSKKWWNGEQTYHRSHALLNGRPSCTRHCKHHCPSSLSPRAKLAPYNRRYMMSSCVCPSATSRYCIETTRRIDWFLAQWLLASFQVLCYKVILVP